MPTLNELGKKVRDKYPGQYDDMTDLEIGRRTLAKYPEEYSDFAGADTNRVAVRTHERNKPKRKDNLNNLADVGGMAGSFVGKAGGIPGAVAGGIIGRSATRVVRDVTALREGRLNDIPSPQDALKEVLFSGAEQGALQAGGNLLFKGAKGLGTKAMQAAIAATPEVAQTAIREGIAPTIQGVKKLMNRMGEAGQQTMNMLRVSTARGNRFDPTTVADGVEQILKQSTETGLPAAADDRAAFEALKAEFLQENMGKTLTPVELQIMKQKAQAFADPIFKAIKNNQGHTIDAKVASKARWYAALQDYAKNALEATTPSSTNKAGQIVSLADANAETAALKRLQEVVAPEATKLSKGDKFLRQWAAPGARLGAGAALGLAGDEYIPGGKAVAALAGVTATHPRTLAKAAMALDSPLMRQLLRQTPRAARATMRED